MPKRRHEVAGFYRHLHMHHPGDPDCQHAYLNETAAREVCAVCGHKRVWVPSHERGDTRRGYVTKTTGRTPTLLRDGR